MAADDWALPLYVLQREVTGATLHSTATMEHLPLELLHHIIDLVVEDSGRSSLQQLSLVNKAFSAYARHCLFQDLCIKTCPEIYVPWCLNRACFVGACETKCIKKLAPLLKARAPPSIIPRRIRTLTLDGTFIDDWSFPAWERETHSGGMDDGRVTGPVLGYFQAVEELRLLQVPIYPLSYWTLLRWRPLAFLSSVRTVVLDDTKFYGGPPALHAFISRMPNLQRLHMKGVRWAGNQTRWPGYPVDVPGWAALLECAPANDSTWTRQTVRETLFPNQWKPIPSHPSHLILHLEDSADALSWIMMPMLSETLNKLSSLEIHPTSGPGNDLSVFLLKRLLASVPNVVDLTFCWHHTVTVTNLGSASTAALFRPDLSLCTSLRTLHLQLRCNHEQTAWFSCRGWLHCMARSIRDHLLSLQDVQVTMDLAIDDGK